MSERSDLAVLCAFAALLLSACGVTPTGEPPLPDLEGVDPEVAAAVEAARDAVQRSPASPEAWSNLGERYRAQLWSREAAACYLRCEALDPGEFRWPYLVGKSLQLEDAVAAEAAFRRAIAIDAGYAPAHLRHGRVLARLGRDADATDAFEAARSLDPSMSAAYLGLGQLALSAGRPAEARELLLQARRLEPDDGRIEMALSRVAGELGEAEAAARHAAAARSSMRRSVAVDDPRAALRVQPLGAFELGRQGRRLLAKGRPAEALPLLRTSVERAPDRDGPRVALGLCLAMLGRSEEAERELRAAVRLHPGNPEARAALGKLLAQGDPSDVEEGLEHLEEAVALDPLDTRTAAFLRHVRQAHGRLGGDESLRGDPSP